jgi:hypothetical protein
VRKKFDRTFGGNLPILLWLQKPVHRWQMLIALKRNNRNVLNWLTVLDIITSSNKCIQNEHEFCMIYY